MAHFDCLLIGHNELDFEQYFSILDNMASSGGREHVAFTDLQLNHVKYRGRPYQALDLLTCLHNEDRPKQERREFYNGDCLWTAIAYLGSYLSERGYTFDYVNLFHSEKELLKEKLQMNRYELIVLTGTMYVFEQNIWEVIAFVRRHCPEARIIAGGPYISKQAEEREPEYMKPLFRYLNADFYCYVREGEQTLVTLLDALKHGTDLSTVPNLAYRAGRDYAITPKRREVNPLAENLIDYSLFADAYRRSGWANVRISDGCPYACGFCAFPEHGNERYMLMTLDRIEQEFDAIQRSGTISHIFFIDATLNVPRRQFKRMLQMMIDKQYGFRWHCFFRCDQTDEETIWLMKEAGCLGVFLGLESANATVLGNMDKTAHKEDFRRAFPWLKAAGLRQMVSVLVGFPGETIETFRETLDFVEEIQPDFTRIQTWYCDPTTPVWFRRAQFGLQGKGYSWRHDTMESETAVELVVDAFMSLRGASWMPDPGYNWTATYLMETFGMSIPQQKAFIKLFSAAAKEQLLSRETRELEPPVLQALRDSCAFDRPPEPNLATIDGLSGERYLAAKAFWVDEFYDAPASTATARQLLDPEDLYELDESDAAEVAAAHTARWEGIAEGAGWRDLLAAYRWTLGGSHLDGAMLVALPDDVAFPMRLRAPTATHLDEYRAANEELLERSCRHQRFGWFVLTHPLTAKELGIGCPPLQAAFLADEGDASEEALQLRWRRHPGVANAIDVILIVSDERDGPSTRFELSCTTDRYDDEALAGLGHELLELLGTIGGATAPPQQLGAAG